MKAVIQRVIEASVTIDGNKTASIGKGLMILLGISVTDSDAETDWLVKKISSLRIFGDKDNAMNLSVQDVDGEVLVVSQFTLHASTKKGNRPSFIRSAKPEQAVPIYEKFISLMQLALHNKVKTGTFGADMEINLINDGPVTIVIDTENKE